MNNDEDDFESAEATIEKAEENAIPVNYIYTELNLDKTGLLKLRSYLESAHDNDAEDLIDFINDDIDEGQLNEFENGNLLGVKDINSPTNAEPEFLFYFYKDSEDERLKYSYVMADEPGDGVNDIPGRLALNFGDYIFEIKDRYNLPFIPYGYENSENWSEVIE